MENIIIPMPPEGATPEQRMAFALELHGLLAPSSPEMAAFRRLAEAGK